MGGDVNCGMCGEAEENLEHFLLRCRELRVVRVKFGVANTADVKEILLFGEVGMTEVRSCREYVNELWRRRNRLLGGSRGQLVFGASNPEVVGHLTEML